MVPTTSRVAYQMSFSRRTSDESRGEVEVWTRHLVGGALALAVLNVGDTRYSTHPFHLYLSRLGLHGPRNARDLWSGKEIELTEGMPLELTIHDVLLVRIAAPK